MAGAHKSQGCIGSHQSLNPTKFLKYMSKPARHRRPLIEALEPRLLFSATADIAVFDDGHADGQNLAQAAEQLDLLSIYQPDDALPVADMSGAEPAPVAPVDDADDTAAQADIVFNDDPAITTLVFVDTAVDNYQALVSDIQDRVDASSVAIIYLDSGSDGLGQISDYLAGFSGISAIHIISHGVAGNLQLGNQVLNENNLTQFKTQLEGWQTALDPDADILLYGCELAANQSGLNFLQQLGDFTGADVAASNDLTGNSRADADWELEAHVGQIETASIFSSADNMQWQGVLADVVHLYSGVATNEQAIPTAGYVMQGVQLTSSETIDRIQVMLANHGTSSTSVQMLVHQHSYNGTVVASATVNTASLGSSLAWVNFDFAQTTLNAYSVYWVEFRTNNGADNLVGIGYVNSNVIASEFVVNGSGDGNKDMSIALVDAENRVPTVANAIANQVAAEEAMFSYTFAANTFNDQDGDALTYTATRGDGTPLPAWLNFNAATRTFSGVPDDGDVGTLTIKLTASDGKGGTVDDWFDLAVNNVNDDPFLNIPVSNQNATEDSAFTYTFPANTFGDGDVGASLTYTAELADGSALPAWLHLDSATLTFSGTPANADVGTISVKLIANDGAGGIASDTFDIVVANTNDAPVVANAIADQFATENSLFNYSFPTNTFSDPDVGDTLTYSAHIAGALPLPGWLTFDAATRTFSGTPSNGDVGSYTLRVTATDGSGSFTTHDFDIVVQNVGSTNSIIDTSGSTTHSQILSTQRIYQSFTNDFNTGTYTIDSIVLQLQRDPSASVQTITVTLLAGAYNGTVIDSATISSTALDTSLTWKAFDFTNNVLSDSIVYYIAVESSSNDGLVAVGIHNIDAYPDGTLVYSSGTPDLDRDLAFQVTSGSNTDPALLNAIPAQNATEDAAFNFQFASNTFSDVDGDTLTYTATLYNGAALPSWLSFNAATRSFSGTPANGDVGTLSIKVTATDGFGGIPATDTFDLIIANTNDAPTVANPIADQNATEDSPFNFTFASNTFTDPDAGYALTYSAQLANGGALPTWLSFDAGTRTFSGTPTNAFVGTVAIDVIANDSLGGTVIDTFNIVVANTNDAPIVDNTIPNQNATEDAAFNFQFAPDTFSDPDTGDTLIYSAQLAGGGALPSWLSFNAATRTFSGTPTNADVGSFSIDVMASDGNGGSVTDTFSITVTNVNDAPSVSIALTDYFVDEQDTINLHGTGISIADVDSNMITLTLASSDANSVLTANLGATGASLFSGNGTSTLVLTGTLTQLNEFLAGNNGSTLTYSVSGDTPAVTATLTITANDGALTGNDTATINVAAVNDAPVNTVPGAQVTTEDTALVFSAGNVNQIQISDIDAAAGTLEITLSVTNGTLTLAGTTGLSFTTGDGTADSTLVFTGTLANINAALATLTYNPTANYSGSAVLSITTSDLGNTGTGGTLTDTDTVDITVNAANDAPTVTITPTTYNATEQTWMDLHATGISVADVDGDTLTITLTGAGSNSNFRATVGTTGVTVVSGIDTNTLVLSGTAAQLNDLFAGNNGGTLTYLLTGNTPVSSVLLTISASDGALSGNDTATINITAVNDAPVNTVPVAQVTNEDTALVFSAGNGNQIQIDDLDAGAANLEVTLSVTNGTLTLAGTTGLSFTTGDGSADSTLVFSGTLANINTALATLTYNPTANYSGGAVLSITTSDLGNSGSGGTLTDTDTVNITVNSATDNEYIDTGGGGPFDPVSSTNQLGQSFAFDSPGATYTVNEISLHLARYDAAQAQTITVELRDAWNGAIIASDSIASSQLSRDGFEWHTFSFAGVALNDQQTYVIQISSTGSDGMVLVGRASGDVFAGGAMIENGVPNASGWDLAFKVAKDDGTNSAPVIDFPIADQLIDAELPFNLVVPANTSSDPDPNDTITYRAQLSGGGSLGWLTFNEITRTFSGTPHWHQAGTITVELIATDNHGASTSDFFDITVVNTNNPPTVANPISDQVINEDVAFSFQFDANTFADADGNPLMYSADLAVVGGLPPWLSFDPATRTFSGTPVNGDVGNWTIEVTADDGFGGTVTDTFVLTVANTNDAPTILNPIGDQTILEDQAFNFQFVDNTFTDVDLGTVFTYSAQLAGGGALPAWLSFDAATRTFSGTPANGDVGTIAIDVIANDGNGGTVTDSFNIVVINTNDVPVVANPIVDQNATEDSAFRFQFAANTFSDADGNPLAYTVQLAGGGALPAWLSFDAATRTFSGTPTNGDVGTLSIAVIANDGNGGTVTDSFNIVIANTNDAPVVASLIPDQTANEEAAFNFQVAANTFTDVDFGTVFTYSAQLAGGGALPAWLSFDAATRTFSGTPASGDIGTIAIDVIASDGDGAAVYDTFNIRVVNTNDAPRALGLAPVNNQEDASGNSVDLWAGFSDEESPASQLQYRLVSNSNPALVASAVIDPATGKLQLQYGAHQFGTSDLVIRAQDQQGAWVETSLRVTITSVNDMPISTGIADMQVTAGTAPLQTNLRAVFSDIEQGTQLQYALQGNSNPAIVPQVQIDAATGIMTLTFSSVAGGESIITLRALDADGAWVETQFKVTVAAAAVEIPVMPPPPGTSSPTAPPVLPPVETPVLTPPEVNPPGMGGGTGGGAGNEPAAPGDALNPVVPIASFPLGSEMNGDGYDRDLQNKSSLDYLRAEEALGQRDISLMTLAPTSALESLIKPDAGFAPWETADFDSEVRRMREQMDEAMDEEQERKAVVAGLTFSVTTGLLIWALRASTLLLTMMSMLPLWRGFDPLPILDEVDKKKKELEQQRKDREREDKNAKEVGYLFDHAQNKKSRP